MGGLGDLVWRLTLTPSTDLKRDESEAVMGWLAQFGSQAALEDSSTVVAPEGEHVMKVGLSLRSGDARFPREILSPVEEILRFLRRYGYRWSFSIYAYERSSFYDVRLDDIDVRAALLQLGAHWDSGGSGAWRWTADHWWPVDLGSTSRMEPKPGVLLVDYQPGDLNFTDAPVPTSEIISLFGSTQVESGSLSQPPRRWTGKGGIPLPGPIELTVAFLIGSLVSAFVKGFGNAAGTDAWEALKRGLGNLRKHPRPEVRDATVSVAARVGNGWLLLQGPSIDGDALTALESIGIPALPATDFEWVLEWEPEGRRWVLLLNRYMPNRPE